MRCNGPLNRDRTVSAMTMIEVLIVVAVIGVLMLLLIPLVSSIKASGSKAGCISNLRELGIANINYMNDNRGEICSITRGYLGWYWFFYLHEYQEGTFSLDDTSNLNERIKTMICPADPTNGTGNLGQAEVVSRSYNVNGNLTAPNGDPLNINQFPRKSKTAYLCDMKWWVLDTARILGDPAYLDTIDRKWHGGGANIVFLDGHVESFKIDSLYPGKENHWVFTGE